MKTGTIIFIKGNAIRIGREDFFINDTNLNGAKEGSEVEYENEGLNLKTCRPAPTGPQLTDDQTVLTSVHLEDPTKPFIVLTNTRGQFSKIVLPVAFEMVKSIPVGKFIRYKTNRETAGTPIEKIWEVDAAGKGIGGGNGNHQTWKPKKTLTIGGTINLENYENLKIEISGPFNSVDDAKALQKEFREVAYLFRGDMVTKGLVERYMNRTCGEGNL